MKSLVKEMKFKTGGYSSLKANTTTRGWMAKSSSNVISTSSLLPACADDNIESLVLGSTRVVEQFYLHNPSPKAKELLKRLNNYKKLPKNWDSYGAIPPDGETVSKSYSFVLQTDELDLPLYFTSPGPNGEIVVEYRNDDRTAEIYFNEDGTEEMILYKGNVPSPISKIIISQLIEHLR